MNKNTICLSIMTALLAGSFVISGCDELYAVKAMKEKQQTRSTSVSPAPAYTEETKSPEEIEEQKKDYTSTGRYKDRFLYEKEAPLKPEKELKAEEGAPATKTETAIAASGPDEMNRLRELREEDDKKATAEGKTRPRKIERSDVGLTDPINVPKQQNAEKLTPPAELLRPISLNDTEKKEKGAVPSKPMEEKTSNNDQVNDELKKLASKIENKKSPVLPKDESQETPAPTAAPKAEPVVASSTKSTETPVPAAGEFDWNKLSAAKNTPAPAAAATPAKAEPMSAIPAAKEEPKTAAKVEEPVKTEPAVKPEPKVETPKPAPAVKPEAEVKPVPAPAPAPAPAIAVKPAEPAKKPVPVTEARKEEKSSDDSWEMEFVEKTEVAKAEPAKPAPKLETPKPAETKVEKKTDDNLDWGLPEKKTVKEPAVEAATEEPEPKAEEPATVEIKLANSLVPENTYDSNTKKTTPTAAPAEKPVEVAVATPKPAAPAETDKEAEMKLAAENKRKVEVMTKQVQILVKENNDKEALKVINKILAIDPDNSWAKETKNDIQSRNAPKAPKPSTTVKPAPVAAAPEPAPVPATPKPAPAPAIKPAPVVTNLKPTPKPEPVFATNEDRTFKGWPGSGMVLKSGMDRLLSWLPDDASKFSNLRLMFTSDGGRKWKTVASNLRPGHAAAWAVPVVTSDNCRLKIVGTDSSGQDVTLAISEKFSVNTGVWETLDSAVVK